MALVVNLGKDATVTNVTVDRRLWLTADRSRVVEDGDPAAAFLWAVEGREVPHVEAERVGYTPASTASDAGAVEPDTSSVETDAVPAAPADAKVTCPEDGCDYAGTERGLKIHARSHASDAG